MDVIHTNLCIDPKVSALPYGMSYGEAIMSLARFVLL